MKLMTSGEGRNARYLLNKNYNVLATDISQEAINYCTKNDITHKNNYKVLDVLSNNSQDKFLEVMGDNINPEDWLKYLHSINWYLFLRECSEIDEFISTLNKHQELKKLKVIITKIHSFS